MSNLIDNGYANAAANKTSTTTKDGKEETTVTLKKVPNVQSDVSSNLDSQTGIYYSLNDFHVYIFKGNGVDVKDIYDTFNRDATLSFGAGKKLTLAYDACGFDEHINIVPDKLNFNGKITYTTEDLDKLTKSGIFGAIRNGAEGLMNVSNLIGSVGSVFGKGTEDDKTGSVSDFAKSFNEAKDKLKDNSVNEFPLYINRFKNIPYYTDYNMESLTNITFKFAFGQSRLFDSLNEVVKPIVGFINLFNMTPEADTNFFKTNNVMPSKSLALTKMYESLFKTGGKLSEGESAPSTSDLFEKLALKFSDMITQVGKGQSLTGLFFRIGRHIMGPYIPTSIEWNFDFSRVDENGYPCAGDITFNGLKMIDMHPDYIKEAWGLY